MVNLEKHVNYGEVATEGEFIKFLESPSLPEWSV
jgi:hypothetical protein